MPFDQNVTIIDNVRLRIPQHDGWQSIRDHFEQDGARSEVGIILPVGCGKSGLIAITPYALRARRALIIAPGTRIRDQLANDLRVSSATNFYAKCGVLADAQPFPETVLMASGRVNMDDLRHCDFAVANIQQIAGDENRWLDQLDPDFFDLILVDEAHHNTAASWQQVKRHFPAAKLVNFSATPTRADGAVMDGEVI